MKGQLQRYCLLALCFSLIISMKSIAQIIVQTTDFIPDAMRTNFNGFEGITVDDYYMPSYSEDGITVRQVNGGGDIVTTYWMDGEGKEGQRCWYPRGGDYGYTVISRSDGSDFQSIGFLRSSGSPGMSGKVLFELFKDGAFVFSGNVPQIQARQYLGFSGGGFDEIRVRDADVSPSYDFYNGTRNALAIDSIELSNIPEPCTLLLLGLGGLLVRKR